MSSQLGFAFPVGDAVSSPNSRSLTATRTTSDDSVLRTGRAVNMNGHIEVRERPAGTFVYWAQDAADLVAGA